MGWKTQTVALRAKLEKWQMEEMVYSPDFCSHFSNYQEKKKREERDGSRERERETESGIPEVLTSVSSACESAEETMGQENT